MPFSSFHWPDLIPLVIIALLIFGPKWLPEMGAGIGKTIKDFQRAMRDIGEPTGCKAQSALMGDKRPALLALQPAILPAPGLPLGGAREADTA
jgi:sec-independent protein translocase protein TatA